MLQLFNNIWVIGISLIILYVIINKILNFNKCFDQDKFIKQYKNEQKLKKKFKNWDISKGIPLLTSYYIGI
jgi:hypothetical protein